MEEIGLNYEALIFIPSGLLRPDVSEVPDKHLKYWFSHPGVQEWWVDFKARQGGFAFKMTTYIDSLIGNTTNQ